MCALKPCMFFVHGDSCASRLSVGIEHPEGFFFFHCQINPSVYFVDELDSSSRVWNSSLPHSSHTWVGKTLKCYIHAARLDERTLWGTSDPPRGVTQAIDYSLGQFWSQIRCETQEAHEISDFIIHMNRDYRQKDDGERWLAVGSGWMISCGERSVSNVLVSSTCMAQVSEWVRCFIVTYWLAFGGQRGKEGNCGFICGERWDCLNPDPAPPSPIHVHSSLVAVTSVVVVGVDLGRLEFSCCVLILIWSFTTRIPSIGFSFAPNRESLHFPFAASS